MIEQYKSGKLPTTIRASNLMYGMMKWFYNKGHYRTCSEKEAHFIDQRVFGPAVARGMLAFDGAIWYITEIGVEWMKAYENRDAWKQYGGNYSHFIRDNTKLFRVLKVIEGGREVKAG